MPSSSSITGALSELCDWLTVEVRPARQTADKLGTVSSTSTSAIYLRPRDPAFASGIVSHGDGAAQPTSYVELQLAIPGAVTVDELTKQFGASSEPPLAGADAAPAIHFAVDRGHPMTCLVVAKAGSDDESVAHGKLRTLAIRVDPRL